MNEYKKEDIRNIHYNNKNEIQFEYGGQVHHYRMENLKEVFINCWNLQQENKQLKEVIDKAIELLGNYKHYSTPDEKQNSDNEDLVNNAFDILKEVE